MIVYIKTVQRARKKVKSESRLACDFFDGRRDKSKIIIVDKKEMNFLGQIMRSAKPLTEPHKPQL